MIQTSTRVLRKIKAALEAAQIMEQNKLPKNNVPRKLRLLARRAGQLQRQPTDRHRFYNPNDGLPGGARVLPIKNWKGELRR